MAKKQDQAGLPGIPQAPKRKVIDAMEEFGLADDKLAAKITKLNDERAENRAAAIAKIPTIRSPRRRSAPACATSRSGASTRT